MDLLPHLFRTEFSKITAVLCKRMGIAHLETAEDLAGETFLLAYDTWPYKGVPENPTAWLYAVAKNKLKNHLHRNQVFSEKIVPQLQYDVPAHHDPEIDLSEKNITDSQLQMLFAICHPSISVEAQIGLALRILCGFGIEEIATAFLTNKETVNKRLFRAREKLRLENMPIEMPAEADIPQRLDAVLTTVYLLFNEGYYSESNDVVLRKDLCLDAMRLTSLLLENPQTNQPAVHAVFALMCFHASRFEARTNERGEMILYDEQDESRWNRELIARGAWHLHQATQGTFTSRYHLEAGIAYWHTIKADTPEKWDNILQLYNRLLQIEYSPIAALNRTYALSKVHGKKVAIAEAEKLRLTGNPYYFTLLGELYTDIDAEKAKNNFQNAYHLAKSASDRNLIRVKLDSLEKMEENKPKFSA